MRLRDIALICFSLLGACTSIPKPRLGQPTPLSAEQLKAVEEGAAKGLKDPYSARFDQTQATRDPGGVVTVCGMINAKNAFGAYVGAKPFVGVLMEYSDKASGRSVRVFHLGVIGSDAIAAGIVIDQCHAAGIVF